MSEGSEASRQAAIPSEAELDALFERLSNWGRWGDDDERGMLNNLQPEHAARAAAEVRDGLGISLAHDLDLVPTPETPVPAQHHMLAAGDAREESGIPGYEASRDFVGCHVHGLGVTHIDALCHMFVDGRMYNGLPASEVRSDGARRNSILSFAEGIVGRGVLLDVAGARGVDFIAGSEAISRAELEQTARRQGVELDTGDILLVATGRDARRAEAGGKLDPTDGMVGLHVECLPWLYEREIALLGCDGISDPMPGLGIPDWPFPIHQIGITSMGLHLIDNLALGSLARACAERGRWSFLFSLGAIRVPGATGCPVNPIALL
ncbi:MAG: cyclase family protein [Deltaproteobacteria bacterium]|jgi:kynurenine formamidase|nr:cyclase family protein [Deltaproteobacteria bacterium]MBW2497168.1 cyclase family protein [Deltaproteobacteria bacterium]